MDNTLKDRRSKQDVIALQDPPVARALFGAVRWSWIWLIIRLYVGYEWLIAGWAKVRNPAWVGAKAGTALNGFVSNALSQTSGAHPNVQGWYGWFLQNLVATHTTFWSYLVAWGETLVGVALIVGIFTGIAAFFGSFMNLNYLLAGTVSINPILFVAEIGLLLAWKTAGWWGLDRWVLPAVGTPWRLRYIFEGEIHSGEQMVHAPTGD
jgi:thiosulfate dehydrogenase [quinone] large subunit